MDVEDAHGDVIGFQQINLGDDDKLIAIRIHQATVRRLTSVFIPPRDYERSVKRSFPDEQIFLVFGAEGSGKLTCAVNFACHLRGAPENAKIDVYRRRADEARSLIEAVQCEQIRPGSVLILEDVFEKNVSTRDLQSPEVDNLQETLRAKDVFLLLTTELDERRLDAFSVVKIGTGGLNLEKVLSCHLEHALAQARGTADQALIERVSGKWPDLRGILCNPPQIERFCEKLAESAPRTDEDLLRLAQQAALLGKRALREWFSRLRSNEKLFAMLTYLFAGTERPLLEEMYADVVKALRCEGVVWISDPRKLGLEDVRDAIECQELGGLIEFKDQSFEREVCAQVGNWPHLLWPAVEGLVEKIDPDGGPEDWQVRRALGTAIGRLAPHGRSRYGKILDHLAGHRSRKVAVTAGYALEEAVRRDAEVEAPAATATLRSWIDSGEPGFMWCAGAAVWRVFAAVRSLAMAAVSTEKATQLQDDLLGVLERFVVESGSFSEEVRARIERELKERLAARQSKEGGAPAEARTAGALADRRLWKMGESNRACATIAAQKIFLMSPARSALLAKWLQESGKKAFRKEVAQTALAKIFEILTSPRYRPAEARHACWLDLVRPVLESAGQGERSTQVVRHMFEALGSWLRWKEWREPVCGALLDVAHRGSGEVRRKLRAALSHRWLAGGNTDAERRAREIAQAVIARSYVMDGILMDRPSLGRGVFVLDPALFTGDPETRAQKEGACRHLLGILEAQIDVTFVQLGSLAAVGLDEKEAVTLGADHPVPRLLMPALEATGTHDLRLALVLSGGAIWDLEDVLGQPWTESLFLVRTAGDEGDLPGVETIRVGNDLAHHDLASAEERLQARWARALAAVGPADWFPVLQSFGIGEEIGRNPRACLEEWVEDLGDTSQATGHGDLARRIVCAFCWYAASDLRGCAKLLREWLTGERSPSGPAFRLWMGSAAAKALFRIHGAHHPAPEDPAPAILFRKLADPLAAQGKDGTEAVLQAVRRWIEVPEWAVLFAGGVVGGRSRLLRWAERHVPQHAEALRAALPKRPEVSVDRPASTSNRLAAFMDRLRLRIALGRPKVLPELEAGEGYGLIVLDVSDPDARSFDHLAGLAGELFERLDRRSGDGLKPVIYRLGERQPAWVAGDPKPPREALAPKEARLPRLLAPILSDGLSPNRVRFLLVLSTQPLLDGEDLIETAWRDRIVLYQPGSGEDRMPAFVTLPSPTAPAIERFLLKRIHPGCGVIS